MIESSIYSTIKTLASGRVYPMVLPETATLPAIVYQRVSSVPVNSLDGDSGLDSVRVQIVTWAASYKAAKDLAKSVRDTLNASSLKIITDNDFDDYEPETKRFRTITDYIVWQK